MANALLPVTTGGGMTLRRVLQARVPPYSVIHHALAVLGAIAVVARRSRGRARVEHARFGPVLRSELSAVRPFDYQVLKTEHIDIDFYPEERQGIDIAARLAGR